MPKSTIVDQPDRIPNGFIRTWPSPPRSRRLGAFTIIEILIVVVVVAIVASLVVPMVSGLGVTQLRSAAQMLVADLEFAQMESMAHGDDARVVVFNAATETYHIGTQSQPTIPITNPVGNQPYLVRYGQGRGYHLDQVTIDAFSLGGDNQVAFGLYGQLDQTTPATITLGAAGLTVVITLDPMTGEASVGAIE